MIVTVNQGIIAVGLALYQSWRFTLILFALMPILVIAGVAGAMMYGATGGDADPFLTSGAVSQEIFMNIRTVLAFPDLITVKTKKFQNEIGNGLPVAQKRATISGLTLGLNMGIMYGVVYGLGMFFALSFLVKPGLDDISDIFGAFFGAMFIGQGLGQVQ